MDSIGSSTLTAVAPAAEVSSILPATSASKTGPITPVWPDRIEISSIPTLSQAEQTGGSNPTQFQAVLTDAVRELKAAAVQTSDPFEAAYFLDLAGKFQALQESGGSGANTHTSGAAAAG